MTAPVYLAARRVYIGTSADVWADDAVQRAWALKRWAGAIPKKPYDLAFWVISQSAQDGHA